MPPLTGDEYRNRPCTECKLEIPYGATICTHCNSFLRSWKNHLRYFANIAAAITLIFGAIAYIITAIPSVKKLIAGSDNVELLSFGSLFPMVLANNGDGNVFVTHLYLSGNDIGQFGGLNYTVSINRLVRPGEILEYNEHSMALKHLRNGYETVAYVSNSEWQEIRKSTTNPNRDSYYVGVFMIPQDPFFQMYWNSIGDSLRIFEATSILNYYSMIMKKRVEQPVPMIGIVLKKMVDEC